MSRKNHLAELQLAIMQVLWSRGEATVADVREALNDKRPLAHTTIATMLTKMEAKGHVMRRTGERAHVFRPVIRKDAVRRSMVTDLAQRLFQGDVTQMVAHLLEGSDVDNDELKRLKQLIRRKEQETRRGS